MVPDQKDIIALLSAMFQLKCFEGRRKELGVKSVDEFILNRWALEEGSNFIGRMNKLIELVNLSPPEILNGAVHVSPALKGDDGLVQTPLTPRSGPIIDDPGSVEARPIMFPGQSAPTPANSCSSDSLIIPSGEDFLSVGPVGVPTPATAPLNSSSQLPSGLPPKVVTGGAASKPPSVPVGQLAKTSFSVPLNGKVNELLRVKIESKGGSGAGKVLIREVYLPEDLGIFFDPVEGVLYGTPSMPGEFRIKVRFQFESSGSDPNKMLESECLLIVNPDPKALWKNLPSDQTDPYWKKDEESLSIPGNDGFRVLGASKRGRSHAHVGSFRDDDFCLLHEASSGWRVLAVADGAGSAKKSRQGSLIASRRASESVMRGLSQEKGKKLDGAISLYSRVGTSGDRPVKEELYHLFGQAAHEAVRAIDEEAKAKGAPYKDYSTTLLVAIHKKVVEGHFVAAYWVGDGAVALYRRGKEIRLLGKVDSGEFAGQTRFLDPSMVNDSTEIWNRVNFALAPDFTALFVATDGISDPLFETDANLENSGKWDLLWDQIMPVLSVADPEAGLLSWLDFWSAGNHDDRTIVLLYPESVSSATFPEEQNR